MRDAAADFVRALKTRAPGGAYIFYGEEPQLIEEARAALRTAGEYKNVERASLELFGDSSRPDSRIAASPGDALFGGGATLYEVIAHAPPSGIRAKKAEDGESGGALRILQNIAARVKPPDSLAISFYGLERRHHKAKWFLDLGKNAVVAHCARLDAGGAAAWCRKWADEWKVPLSKDALSRLAEQTEGNLAAAKQCLQKMRISGGGGEEQVAEALSGGARFNIFHLTDAALSGEGKKSLMILNVLWEIQEPPPLILWAISAAASGVLAAKRGEYSPGLSSGTMAKARKIANSRVREDAVLEVLRRAAHADRVIKGADEGDIKIALTDAVAGLACLSRGSFIPTPSLQIR